MEEKQVVSKNRVSNIGWTCFTWNIAVGCDKITEGCKNCYMMRDGERWNDNRNGVVRRTQPATFNAPLTKWRTAPDRSLVFTSSLTDVFHEEIDSYRAEMWTIIKQSPHLIFQILTKRPERVAANLPDDWGGGYPNVWLGVTVENQKRADERLPILKTIPAAVKFISVEPMLSPVTLSEWQFEIDWVIIGGESGNGTEPEQTKVKYGYRAADMVWYTALVGECKRNNIPVFFKQLGTHLARTLLSPAAYGKAETAAALVNTIVRKTRYNRRILVIVEDALTDLTAETVENGNDTDVIDTITQLNKEKGDIINKLSKSAPLKIV